MPLLKGSCHCGATRFEVTAEPESVTRCTCTFCHKAGTLWAYYKVADFKLTTPRDTVATYRWQTKIGAHNFCPTCGCRTFSEFPDFSTGKPDFDNPKISVNAWLFDDFELDMVPVTVVDGRNLW